MADELRHLVEEACSPRAERHKRRFSLGIGAPPCRLPQFELAIGSSLSRKVVDDVLRRRSGLVLSYYGNWMFLVPGDMQ